MQKISRLEKCFICETREARGISEKDSEKIMRIEAEGIERHIRDDYVVCLTDTGKEMKSEALAALMRDLSSGPDRTVSFVVGGFIGMADRLVERADLQMSLSQMTFSHELCRIMILEQVYRALSIIKGRKYAK